MQEEKRFSQRTDLGGSVQLHMINKDEEVIVEAELSNVSKSGVGFVTTQQLLVGDCYKARIELWTKDCIDAYLKIIRAEETEDGYQYGSIFFGMQENELMRISIYQLLQQQND